MPAFDSTTRPPLAQRPAARFRRNRFPSLRITPRLAATFWLIVVGSGSAALTCIAIGLARLDAEDNGGKNLHADHLIPKLNVSHRVAAAPGVTLELAGPDQSAWPLPDRNATEMRPIPADRLRALDPAPAVAESQPPAQGFPATVPDADPPVFLSRREATLGDTPMIRTWNTLTLASLLAAAAPSLVSAGTPAADSESRTTMQRLEALRKSVEALATKVDALDAKPSGAQLLRETTRLEKSIVEKIEKVSSDLKNEATTIKEEQLKQKLELQGFKSLQARVQALDDEMATIQQELKKQRKQPLAESSTAPTVPEKAAADEIRHRLGVIERALAALSSPPNADNRTSFAAPIATSFGRVRLVNQYAEPVLFIVNSTPYRVAPGLVREIDRLPAGTLNYEVVADGWGLVRPLRVTTLLPNETLTVTAR